jgi:hypothetical protein
MKKIIRELREFYPEYLRAHNNRANQVFHFAGSTLFFALIALAFILPNYWLVAVAILTGYLLPGIGHRFFQHNESFRSSKPVLCVICAFRMYIDTLTFRIHKKARMAKMEQL